MLKFTVIELDVLQVCKIRCKRPRNASCRKALPNTRSTQKIMGFHYSLVAGSSCDCACLRVLTV